MLCQCKKTQATVNPGAVRLEGHCQCGHRLQHSLVRLLAPSWQQHAAAHHPPHASSAEFSSVAILMPGKPGLGSGASAGGAQSTAAVCKAGDARLAAGDAAPPGLACCAGTACSEQTQAQHVVTWLHLLMGGCCAVQLPDVRQAEPAAEQRAERWVGPSRSWLPATPMPNAHIATVSHSRSPPG